MKNLIILSVIGTMLLTGCGGLLQKDFDALKEENEKLQAELTENEIDLHNCLYSADKLLYKAKAHFKNKEWYQAQSTIEVLISRHKDSPEVNEAEEMLKEVNKFIKKDNKEIVGQWADNTLGIGCVITIYKADGKLKMKNAYKDGSQSDDELIKKQMNGKTRYEFMDNPHGEYYIVENNGNLGMYDVNGKFREAKKVK